MVGVHLKVTDFNLLGILRTLIKFLDFAGGFHLKNAHKGLLPDCLRGWFSVSWCWWSLSVRGDEASRSQSHSEEFILVNVIRLLWVPEGLTLLANYETASVWLWKNTETEKQAHLARLLKLELHNWKAISILEPTEEHSVYENRTNQPFQKHPPPPQHQNNTAFTRALIKSSLWSRMERDNATKPDKHHQIRGIKVSRCYWWVHWIHPTLHGIELNHAQW